MRLKLLEMRLRLIRQKNISPNKRHFSFFKMSDFPLAPTYEEYQKMRYNAKLSTAFYLTDDNIDFHKLELINEFNDSAKKYAMAKATSITLWHPNYKEITADLSCENDPIFMRIVNEILKLNPDYKITEIKNQFIFFDLKKNLLLI